MVQGSDFRVQVLGLYGSGCRIQGAEVYGRELGVQALGFRL